MRTPIDLTPLTSALGPAKAAVKEIADKYGAGQKPDSSLFGALKAFIDAAWDATKKALAGTGINTVASKPPLTNPGNESAESRQAAGRLIGSETAVGLMDFFISAITSYNANLAKDTFFQYEIPNQKLWTPGTLANLQVIADDNGVVGLEYCVDCLLEIKQRLEAPPPGPDAGNLPTSGAAAWQASVLNALADLKVGMAQQQAMLEAIAIRIGSPQQAVGSSRQTLSD